MNAESKLLNLIKTPLIINKAVVKDKSINFAQGGKGDPLLLIHGANIGWGQWYANIDVLAKHFKIFAIDLPGSGKSTKIDFSQFNFERDFVQPVEHFIKIKGLRKVSVIGHSIGGTIALKLALNKKISMSKMILVNPMGFTNYLPIQAKILSFRTLAKILSKTVMNPSRKNMRDFLTSVFVDKNSLDELFIEYFYESIAKYRAVHPFIFMNALTKGLEIDKDLVLVNQLRNISQPTLIVVGDQDPLIPLGKIRENFELIPRVKVEIIKKTGHVPSIEKSAIFNDVTLEFLRTQYSNARSGILFS